MNDKAGAKAALGEYLYHMGKTAHRQGQFERAETALVESLILCDSAEDMRGVAIAVAALAVGAHARGATCWLHVSSDWPIGWRASTGSPPGLRRRSTTTPPRWRPLRTASAARISPMPSWPVNHSRSRMPSPWFATNPEFASGRRSVVDAPSRHHPRVEGVFHLPHLGHGVGHLDEGSGASRPVRMRLSRVGRLEMTVSTSSMSIQPQLMG